MDCQEYVMALSLSLQRLLTHFSLRTNTVASSTSDDATPASSSSSSSSSKPQTTCIGVLLEALVDHSITDLATYQLLKRVVTGAIRSFDVVAAESSAANDEGDARSIRHHRHHHHHHHHHQQQQQQQQQQRQQAQLRQQITYDITAWVEALTPETAPVFQTYVGMLVIGVAGIGQQRVLSLRVVQ